MKNKIIILFITFILIALSYLGYKGVKKQVENKKTEALINKLPEFSFYTLNDSLFSRNSLNKSLALVIFYFHPNCEHCQYEAIQLIKYKESFKDIQILMVSTALANELKIFSNTYQLNQFSNIKILRDSMYQFENYFGSAHFPTVLIYSIDWNLVRKYKGEIKIDLIISSLK
jgi:thiol-disulfide isomerase/thioredoxin